MEHFKGASGQEIDSQGIPWNEIHTDRELRRLDFEKWRQEQSPDNHVSVDANPFPATERSLVVYADTPVTIESFFAKRSRKKPKIDPTPGI